MVLKRQCLFIISHDDVVHVDGFADERSGLGIGDPSLVEIRADPVAQALGLANVNDLALRVLVEIHAGGGGNSADFLLQIHGERTSILEEAVT